MKIKFLLVISLILIAFTNTAFAIWQVPFIKDFEDGRLSPLIIKYNENIIGTSEIMVVEENSDVHGRCVLVTNENTQEYFWDIKLELVGVDVTDGDWYIFYVDLKSDRLNNQVRLYLETDDEPWDNISPAEPFDIGDSWQTYPSNPFVATVPDGIQSEEITLQLHLGKVEGRVWIDNLKLLRYDPSNPEYNNTTCYTQSDLEAKYSEGYQEGLAACDNSENGASVCESATFDKISEILHLPYVDLGQSCWADLKLVSQQPALTFELIQYGQN